MSATTSEATPLRAACTVEPPRSSAATGTPVNCSTIAGPLTKAKPSATMTARSATPSSRAGPDSMGPVTHRTIGTTPEAETSERAAMPQP